MGKQQAYAYKYSLINIIDQQNPVVVKERTYFGYDCFNDMLKSLTNDWKTISTSNLNYLINLSEEAWKRHRRINKCDVCNSRFNKINSRKMKHHFQHLKENNYAATLCAPCVFTLRSPYFLPVVIHNFSDNLTLILKEYDDERFDFEVNEKDGMKFYSPSVGELNFIDSCNMLKAGLSFLACRHIGNLSSKVILSSFEDKRYYIGGLNSYGYGHHNIRKISSSDFKGD